LSDRHYWRKYYHFFPASLSVKSAKAEGLPTDPDSRWKFMAGVQKNVRTPAPPAGWTTPEFDDREWTLVRGRQFLVGDMRMIGDRNGPEENTNYSRSTDPFLPECGLVAQRGKFLVKDRAAVRRLTLSVIYRGGFVACLNGQEVARASMPTGEITPTTPAEDYPLDAWFLRVKKAKPVPLHWFEHPKSDQWALRERTFGPVSIPLAALREGENVLALEMHRSDYPAGSRLRFGHLESPTLFWATVGLARMELVADAQQDAVAPLEARRNGVQAWPVETTLALSDLTAPNHDERLAPMRLVAARNGRFAGQVMVTSTGMLELLKATASNLVRDGARGNGAIAEQSTIPASAVEIRYGAVNPTRPAGPEGLSYMNTVLPADAKVPNMASLGRRFDLLLDEPPANVSAVPVWVTVNVPKGILPGRYKGQVQINVKGNESIQAPIDLYVADWTLPDLKDYIGVWDIYQSPDTLVDTYKVKPWSEEHWALIEKSLKLIGQAGGVAIHIPLLAESSFGNAESMVPWIKAPMRPGEYQYDFSAFDRYVDLAARHLARLRYIVVNVWDRTALPLANKKSLVTVIDKSTGQSSHLSLTAEEYTNEKLWRPLLEQMRDRLKTKGLLDKMIYGVGVDQDPSVAQTAMFHRILPELKWVRESHFDCRQYVYDLQSKAAVPVVYTSRVWGGEVPDPAVKRMYGWTINPQHIEVNFNRVGVSHPTLTGYPPPGSFRYWMEGTFAMGRNGNGRCGADYWNVNLTGSGWNNGTRFCTYPESTLWALGIAHNVPDLLGPSPSGPVTTVRFENARQGNQEAEVRAFIEKGLLDMERPLPVAMRERMQALLDARTNQMRLNIAPSSRLELMQLFDAAAEVARLRKSMVHGS
jgi:hypothetical protein